MSAMGERLVLERTVTTENDRTVLHEKRIYGVLNEDGVFRLRAYRERHFSVRQNSGEQRKNGRTAA